MISVKRFDHGRLPRVTNSVEHMAIGHSRSRGLATVRAGSCAIDDARPAVYKWGTAVIVPTSITLRGSSTDVWIFQIAQTLTMASSTSMILEGGARPENIFWQVSEGVSLGTTAHLEGIVMAKTAITLGAAASVNGRLMSQTAVTLISNTIVEPAH